MVIRKGSIYWVDFSPGKGPEPVGRRPGLVIQNDILNDSNLKKINTTASLRELAGGWSEKDARNFKESIKLCEQIDKEMWT